MDNSSGGSPGFCSRRQLRSKPLQGSLDSILTFSDYEQDTHPDVHRTQTDSPHGLKLHPLGRTRGRRRDPDLSSPSQDAATVDASSTLDLPSLDGRHRQRRRSEPAIAYLAKFGPCASGSTGEDEDGEYEDGEEELSQKPGSHSHPSGEAALNLLSVRSAALEASSSSLSSTPTSPAPTGSSLNSLDSLHSPSSDHAWATRRELNPTKTPPPSNSSSLSVPSSTVSSALTSGGLTDLGAYPKGSPPKEPLNWGTLKSCRGLHPNSWLKKGRRLSLTQQDNLEKEEEEKTGVSKTV